MKFLRYKFFKEITSDVMFEAYGKNKKDVFVNAATALMSVICQIYNVGTKKERRLEVKADNASELMFKWLQAIIALVDTSEMFFSKFTFDVLENTRLKARLYGEPATPEKGETVVKAVTYYKYKFSQDKKGYRVRASLDV